MRIVHLSVCGTLAALAAACGDDAGAGSLRLMLSAEETISEGLKVGQDEENTRDSAVTYSKFLVSIGRVRVDRTSPTGSLSAPAVYIADLRQAGEEGLQLGTTFDDLEPGQWSSFGYATPPASADATRLAGVNESDAQEMISKQLTYWIEGRVDNPTHPVDFVLKVSLDAVYSNCQSNDQPGISIGEGGTSTASITLHGDHLWFNTVSRGDETTVTRYADWMVLADQAGNGDGRITAEDLATVPAEKVFPSAKGYNLTGGPIAVSTALDFVRAQLATQGHLNGEGECESLLR